VIFAYHFTLAQGGIALSWSISHFPRDLGGSQGQAVRLRPPRMARFCSMKSTNT
jgi:hypothetical protein